MSLPCGSHMLAELLKNEDDIGTCHGNIEKPANESSILIRFR